MRKNSAVRGNLMLQWMPQWKLHALYLALAAGLVVTPAASQAAAGPTSPGPTGAIAQTDAAPLEITAVVLEQGRSLYIRQCARCHQRDGRGIEDLYPNLRDASQLWTNRNRPVEALLAGRSGPLTLESQTFNNVMPTHGYLGNETIANTLSFMLHEWGPGGNPYTAEEVAAQRLRLLESHPGGDYPLPDQSPLAEMSAQQYVTSEGPPMTVQEFEDARRLYYGRCTGCHGVLRHGTAGTPLTPELMRERGTGYLQSVINYGSSSGMPNWGTSEALSAEEINMLARFLQHPVPQPPDMDLVNVRDSWFQRVSPGQRPESRQHPYPLKNLFVATLHDLGQIAILDGESKRLITKVEVGRGPHRVSASATGAIFT